MGLADDFDKEMKELQSVPPGMKVRASIIPPAADPESRTTMLELSVTVLKRYLTEALRELDNLREGQE